MMLLALLTVSDGLRCILFLVCVLLLSAIRLPNIININKYIQNLVRQNPLTTINKPKESNELATVNKYLNRNIMATF